MFKETPTVNQNEPETIIGPSVKVEGDFVTEGNIIIEGIICGTIKTAKNLKMGAKAKIFANVTAENALVSGEIQGNVKIKDRLELTPTGKIYGDIKVGTLIIAAGSILNGKCQMTDQGDKATRPSFSKQEKIELENQASTEDEEAKKLRKK